MKETEKELGKVRTLHRKEKRLLEKIEGLRLGLLPSGITYDRDKVQTSPDDTMTKVMSEIDEVERELMEVGAEMVESQIHIGRITDMLPPKERYVLRQYYLNGHSAQAISEAMNITRRHFFRLKNNGISMLERGD